MADVWFHPAEDDRLDSLSSYGVLDSRPDRAFDVLARLAAEVCAAPVGAVTLVDREQQWFKALHGSDAAAIPREHSFCSDAIAAGEPLVVGDAREDPRYRDNPFVQGAEGLRAYAGVPLVGRDGLPLGTLCVADVRPRRFSARQLTSLGALAAQVVALLEQRRHDRADGLLAEGVMDDARDPVRLRRAVEDGELVPHFQPLVDLRTGAVHGLEALVRWQHPLRGTLPPSAFLPAVEAGALVVPVGRAVLHAALAQLADLRAAGLRLPGPLGVNVASGQLARPGLAADVAAALGRSGVEPGALALEITEATSLPDARLARRELTELVALGVHVVIDDFGVGWSNLSRVLELPVDTLKLDRSIAGAVLTDRRAAVMVRSTLAMAADLGLQVCAEGVETEQVAAHLSAAGCDLAQGWLYSPAVPGHDLPVVLRRLEAAARVPASR